MAKSMGGEASMMPVSPPIKKANRNPTQNKHGHGEMDLAPPHGPDPVEEFDPGGHGDEERQQREEGEEDGSGGEHVVGPDARWTSAAMAMVAKTMPL